MTAQDDIRIVQIKVKDLVPFAEDVLQNAKSGQFVPISMQRARAHANNPYADGDDVALLVALDQEGEIVGYFGIMPIMLRVGEERFKVHWFSTWLVSSRVRGKGVGSMLMESALALKQDYLIVGSVHARRVCKKYGFWEREPLIYYWLDLTGMSHLNLFSWGTRLVRRVLRTITGQPSVLATDNKLTRWFEKFGGRIFKKMFGGISRYQAKQLLAGVEYHPVERITRFVTSLNNRPAVELYRGVEAINWMLEYPWVLPPGQSITEDKDYYFSDVRSSFQYIPLEIYDEQGTYKGFVVLSVSQVGSRRQLKLLDYDLALENSRNVLAGVALEYASKFDVDRVELPDEVGSLFKDRLWGKMMLVEKKRIYQCMPKSEGSILAKHWRDIEFHLYDGDMPFT